MKKNKPEQTIDIDPKTKLGIFLGAFLPRQQSKLAADILSQSFRSPVDKLVSVMPDEIALIKNPKTAKRWDTYGAFAASGHQVTYTSIGGNAIPEKMISNLDSSIPMSVILEIERASHPQIAEIMERVDRAADQMMEDENTSENLKGINSIGKRSVTGFADILKYIPSEEALMIVNSVAEEVGLRTKTHKNDLIFMNQDNVTVGVFSDNTTVDGLTDSGFSYVAQTAVTKLIVIAAARITVICDLANIIREDNLATKREWEARLALRQAEQEAQKISKARRLVSEYTVTSGNTFVLNRRSYHEDYGDDINRRQTYQANRDLTPTDFLRMNNAPYELISDGSITEVESELMMTDSAMRNLRDALVLIGHVNADDLDIITQNL